MSVRLIASDMDGTLLDPYTNISQANIDAILSAQAHDVEFIICSGREYGDAKEQMRKCGISCGFICLSGAQAYDSDGTRLLNIPLSEENLSDISDIMPRFHAGMDILTSDGRYTTFTKEERIEELCFFLNGSKPFTAPIPESLLSQAKEALCEICYIQSLNEIPDHIMVYKICSNGIPEETVQNLKDVFLHCPDIAAASSFPTNIELTNVQAQKGNALKAYANVRGIALEDVMALGDSDNDLSMFTPEFGWTVAMENAMPCIRDNARYHTKSNLEDGVAWAIRTFVLDEE